MSKVMVVYYSRTGHTKAMAEYVAKGAESAGTDVILKSVQDAKVEELLEVDGIIMGSPTYYGHSAGILRSFLDESVKFHGKLTGKVGGAFASSAKSIMNSFTSHFDSLQTLSAFEKSGNDFEVQCEESWPMKNCSNNFILIKEGEFKVEQENNCVFIEGPKENLTKISDEVLFNIIGVKQ